MLGPNPRLAIRKYRRRARTYDLTELLTLRARRAAIGRMELLPGHTVIDVGCGTGLSFTLIEAAIGAQGQLVGIDLSPHMLARARQRVERNGWRNVALIESSIEDAEIPFEADAALFYLTHDIMRSRAALENVISHLKSDGRISVFGAKSWPWWAMPLNILWWIVSQRYITTLDGASRPWSYLVEVLPRMRIKPHPLGFTYAAWGARN